MYLTWRQRLELQPEWADINSWPKVDPNALSPSRRKRFWRNLEIVARVLNGEPMKQIAHNLNISASTLTRLLSRCLRGPADENPALSQGLIPGLRLVSSQRRKALSRLGSQTGAAHSFKHLLTTVPGLESYLEKIIKNSVKQSRRGQNLTAKAFHSAFTNYLNGINWPQDTYPFSVPSRGYETLRKYLNQRVVALSLPKVPSRIILPLNVTRRFYEEIQIDEYTVDCHGSVVIELNREFLPLRLARMHLLTARDVATSNILGYVFSLSPAPTADDLLMLLGQLVSPWQPFNLTTPGLAYPPGGCLPTGLGENYQRLMVGVIRMDNALAHLAHSIRHYICNILGSTLNLGLIKYPKGRHVIEQAFAKLNVDLHRLPSTTGSHPHAEIREPQRHQKKAPIVTLRTLGEIISILHVEHNIRPLGNLGGASPLATVQHQMASHLLPMRPRALDYSLNPMVSEQVVTIRQNKHHQPHIHFEGTRYKGPGICVPELINQRVTIRFDRNDIRQLHVTTQEGKNVGQVLAPKTWQRFAHSMTTRKYINRRIRDNLIKREDPLGGYFDYTLDHRELPSQALELVRLYREFGKTEIIKPDEVNENQTEYHLLAESVRQKALKTIPAWNLNRVKRRR